MDESFKVQYVSILNIGILYLSTNLHKSPLISIHIRVDS